MTKKELVEELHNRGEMWADMSYSKKELEHHLHEYDRFSKLSLEQMEEELKRKGLWYK